MDGRMAKWIAGIMALVLFAANCSVAVLVYDGGGTQAGIQQALTSMGIPYHLRDKDNIVTMSDLASHDLLVVGWNYGGDMSGIKPSILEAGITGYILITGHDPEEHVQTTPAARTFLSQAISFARAGDGTGLLALADYSTAFSYLPGAWGISATGRLTEETVTSFTSAGQGSGVFAGLTPGAMSNWANSYHTIFDRWGDGFAAFELGRNLTDEVVVTVGIPEPATFVLLGLAALACRRKRRR